MGLKCNVVRSAGDGIVSSLVLLTELVAQWWGLDRPTVATLDVYHRIDGEGRGG